MDVINLTKDNFQSQIDHGVTLVDFWSTWETQLPIIGELATEYKHRAVIAKLNVDEEKEIAAEYKVTSIPTVMVFKDGYMVESMVGPQTGETLRQKINLYIALGETC
ncbi:co-chaperone YbbN [Paenibacillus sp. R14(2021)]|uniref:thioredoxin family protein n=1 Tax=Paenibacillus sp. R14(2021) TaxID=2859228 RepID=UPI001C616311|nr:thioredoxin domain-containing protein [Paenibacillus sp. R14(2021)]